MKFGQRLLQIGIRAKLIILALLLMLISVNSGLVTYAADDKGNHQCGVDTFFSWGCNGSGEQVTPVLTQILAWLAAAVTVAVVAGVIYGAIVYMTSGGNEANAKKGITIIRNAVIALVVYYLMYALINFLVPGGLFN